MNGYGHGGGGKWGGELSDPEDDVVISTIEVNGESPRTPKECKKLSANTFKYFI